MRVVFKTGFTVIVLGYVQYITSMYRETPLIQHSLKLGKNVRLEDCWITE